MIRLKINLFDEVENASLFVFSKQENDGWVNAVKDQKGEREGGKYLLLTSPCEGFQKYLLSTAGYTEI